MPLPTSGRISLLAIAEEFDPDYPDNLPYGITQFYKGGSYVDSSNPASIPTSGRIGLTDFYGASAGVTRQRTFYRRGTSAPSRPTSTAFGAYASLSGWSTTALAATRTQNVYEVTLTQTFSGSPPSSTNHTGNSWSRVTLNDLSTLVVTITGADAARTGDSVTLTVNIVGGDGTEAITWGGDATGSGETATVRTTTAETLTATVSVTKGTQTATDTHDVVFTVAPAVSVTITADDHGPDANEYVNFTCVTTGIAGTLTYQWRRRQGGTGAWSTFGGNSDEARMRDTGETWQIQCRVTAGGETEFSNVLTITWAVAALEATITVDDASPEAAETVTFTCAVAGGSGTVDEYQWQRRQGSGLYSSFGSDSPTASMSDTDETWQVRCRVVDANGDVDLSNRLTVTWADVSVETFPPWPAWPAWAPAVSTVCDGIDFTQTRTRTRTGSQGTVQTENASQDATGTKAWGGWSNPAWTPAAPAPSTLCEGVIQSVDQTRTRVRTCISLGVTHTETDDQTRTVTVTGTNDCSNYPRPTLSVVLTEAGPQIVATATWASSNGTSPNGQATAATGIIGSATGDVFSFPAGTPAVASGVFQADITEGVDYSRGDRIEQSVRIRTQFADGGLSAFITDSDSLTATGG